MRAETLQTRRRQLVPEVVQTSAMDCGPAALKCLLDGFDMPVSYGRHSTPVEPIGRLNTDVIKDLFL